MTQAGFLLQRIQGFKDYPEHFAVPPELINPRIDCSSDCAVAPALKFRTPCSSFDFRCRRQVIPIHARD
jgi:hypothetical protein